MQKVINIIIKDINKFVTAHLARRINAFAYSNYYLRIHIIVGKWKQVILNHTHHAGGVTDLVGKWKQVILNHTHHTGGVTDIEGLSKQVTLHHTHLV